MSPQLEICFNQEVNRPESQMDLFKAALLIAGIEYPDLEVERYVHEIRKWADDIRRTLTIDLNIRYTLSHINHYLYTELGFTGNSDDYYDPRNSFLNEVMDRRLGTPITLSVIYMEIGRQLKLPIHGVSFPGHFLVKLSQGQNQLVMDPFNGAMPLSDEDLVERLEELYNQQVDDVAPFLSTATKRDVLIRMLMNLKNIYKQENQGEKTLATMNKILTVDPGMIDEYLERGLLLNKLECHHAALKDLSHYLSKKPDSEEAEVVRQLILDLQKEHRQLN